MAASDPQGPIGLVLQDTYRITRKLAGGGMGTVYEAAGIRLTKKRFAIKMLHPSVAQVEEMYTRFRREAEIATELGHPNIIDVLDFNETEDGQPYIVMEFLVGEDLQSRLRRVRRLPPREVRQIVDEAGSALQAAHDRGIVHRDIKPENIFLVGSDPGGEFQVKVLDFGISKIQTSSSVLTKANSVLGTLHYMSPEQALGEVQRVDHTTDIFALGAICYRLLSGRLPFKAGSFPAVIHRLCSVEPTPLTELVVGLPVVVQQVIARALAKRKEDRFQRVDEFARELCVALPSEPLPEMMPSELEAQALESEDSEPPSGLMPAAPTVLDAPTSPSSDSPVLPTIAATDAPTAPSSDSPVPPTITATDAPTAPSSDSPGPLSVAATDPAVTQDALAMLPTAIKVPEIVPREQSHLVEEELVAPAVAQLERRRLLLAVGGGLLLAAVVVGAVIILATGDTPTAPTTDESNPKGARAAAEPPGPDAAVFDMAGPDLVARVKLRLAPVEHRQPRPPLRQARPRPRRPPPKAKGEKQLRFDDL